MQGYDVMIPQPPAPPTPTHHISDAQAQKQYPSFWKVVYHVSSGHFVQTHLENPQSIILSLDPIDNLCLKLAFRGYMNPELFDTDVAATTFLN